MKNIDSPSHSSVKNDYSKLLLSAAARPLTQQDTTFSNDLEVKGLLLVANPIVKELNNTFTLGNSLKPWMDIK